MPFWITAILATCLLTAVPSRSFADELEGSPDSLITREQWQQRVEEARRRSQEFVASARIQTADPPPYQEDVEATDRVNCQEDHKKVEPSWRTGDNRSVSQCDIRAFDSSSSSARRSVISRACIELSNKFK
jgi:hypothetical protein